MAWAALPAGEDIPIANGDAVAAVVSVGQSITRTKLAAALASHFDGLVLDDYAEQGQRLNLGPDPDLSRKYIAVRAHSVSYEGTLSWSKGIFLVAPNLYTIVEAWKLPAGSVAEVTPVPTHPGAVRQTASLQGVAWVGAAALAGSVAYLAWAYREKLGGLRVRLLGR